MAVDTSLFSGSMTMLVLKLLEEQDLYGYEMISVLKEKSNNVFELRTGTLYSLLGTLVKRGYLESYEKKCLEKSANIIH